MSNTPEVQEALKEVFEELGEMSHEEARTLMRISEHAYNEENLHIHSPEFLRIT
jgi:cytoplasmic iron level regulating protein YaaA (DUF328/UPF0246 family)